MSDFDRGVKVGNEATKVTIALNNTWGAKLKNGGSATSYEKIGYHAGSVDFLDGVLSTGVPVVQFIEVDGKLASYEIKKNPWR